MAIRKTKINKTENGIFAEWSLPSPEITTTKSLNSPYHRKIHSM